MLEVTGLCAGYGEVAVLHDIALAVPEGAVTALIGANGAGKTSLLRTISGILRPQSGSILYDGRAIETLAPDRIVAAGLVHVPEGRRLFPTMTVLENLLVGSSASAARARRQESLDFVFQLFPRVHERRQQYAGTLSGGEQQMVAIGRALMACPRLLLLDETSLGLAPLVVEEIFRAIARLKARGMTILIVEQNTALALEAAHYAYVIEHGRIVLQGASGALARDDRVRRAYLGV
ncbi:MAG: ABC transporter ATP-binding protein [Stellaceae bacterium]